MAGYSQLYAYPYEGGNETIDRLHDGLTDLWIVNGIEGRRVLCLPPGTTEEEALEIYVGRYGRRRRKSGDAA